jgi:hypothetical protein
MCFSTFDVYLQMEKTAKTMAELDIDMNVSRLYHWPH